MTESIEERLARIKDWVNRPNNKIHRRYPQVMPPETGMVASRVEIAQRAFFRSPSTRHFKSVRLKKLYAFLFALRRLMTLLHVQNDVNQAMLEHIRAQEVMAFSVLVRLDALESENSSRFFSTELLIEGIQQAIEILSAGGVWSGTVSFSDQGSLDSLLHQYATTQVELLEPESVMLHLFVANGIPWVGAAAKHIDFARNFLKEGGRLVLLVPTADLSRDIAQNFGFITNTKQIQVDGTSMYLGSTPFKCG